MNRGSFHFLHSKILWNRRLFIFEPLVSILYLDLAIKLTSKIIYSIWFLKRFCNSQQIWMQSVYSVSIIRDQNMRCIRLWKVQNNVSLFTMERAGLVVVRGRRPWLHIQTTEGVWTPKKLQMFPQNSIRCKHLSWNYLVINTLLLLLISFNISIVSYYIILLYNGSLVTIIRIGINYHFL